MVSGYQIIEILYESSRSLICRGRRDRDSAAVVLKQLKPDYATPETVTRFKREYDLTRCCHLDGVIQLYGLEAAEHSWVMIEEDGGQSLDRYCADRTLSLEDFLQLAIQLTEVLDEVHQQQILHKDINPSNILVNPVTKKIKLIDFGIATVVSPEHSTIHSSSHVIEGTLAYISPEQTGRINHAVDYRTDFYSLGITFYQLLCDRLPFESTDVLELIHCHIAKQPIAVTHVNPQIPPVVSEMVMKLMAKNPDDRYQSTGGIKADLQTCLHQLQTHGSIAAFPLGQQDVSEQFQLSPQLYGRAAAIETVLAAFERVSGRRSRHPHYPYHPPAVTNDPSHSELLLISGQAGIGKSSLVRAAYRSIDRQRGYCITGKFDLLQQDTPYLPIIQAFQDLVRRLLSESAAQIAVWREQLLAALETNAPVIVAVIPEVELIIGPQPAVAELPAREAQNRFNLVFQQFIRVFAQPDHPLVMFLDDLQWADRASLHLMQVMMAAENLPLLLIAAYRDHELDAAHPVTTALQQLQQLQQQGIPVHSLALAPLTTTDIRQWIADSLNRSLEDVQPLAALIAEKTQGNPLFVRELLTFLHRDKLIAFDRNRRRWCWQLEHIRSSRLAETLVELVIDRVHQLPDPTKRLLQLAAGIGVQFDAQLLATIAEQPQPDVIHQLHPAVQSGLLIPADMADRCFSDRSPQEPPAYRFAHDRIQQTAYSLMVGGPLTHWRIGQALLQATASEQIETKIFEIVHQLNLGKEFVTEQTEKDRLAQLNWIAGNQAKSAIAYDSALTYLTTGIDLLDQQSWTRSYDLSLALYSAAAEAAYLSGEFEQMEQLADVVLHQAASLLDKLQVYETKIQASIARNQLSQAIDMALYTLDLLEVEIPRTPDAKDVLLAANQTKLALADCSMDQLLHLPRMTDPYKLAAMRVIASVCTPTYFTAPQLWQLMVFQKVQLSIHYGNAPGSAFGYGDYGMVLCAVDQDFDGGYQFAQLAATLLPQLNAKAFVPKTLLLINCYLRHWKEHLRTTLEPLRQAYDCGLETGDLEFATFAIAFRAYHAYLVGEELTQLESEMAADGKAIAQLKQAIPLQLNQLYRQVVLNLMGASEPAWNLTGESYNEQQLTQHHTAQDQYILFHFHLNKLMLCYLFAAEAQAAEHANAAAELLSQQATGMLVVPVFYFYSSLSNLAIFDQASPSAQAQILQQVETNQTKMQQWADHAPMNYLHKYYLVEAERNRVLGQELEAMNNYDRAITYAAEYQYLNEEALAQERAATFYLAKDKFKIAQVYLRDALRCYRQWGAIAKVKDLETRYSQWIEPKSVIPGATPFPAITTSGHTESSRLDLATVMKAAQVLTREIVLEQLLTKLLMIVIEHAGAEKGYLLLETNGEWAIAAAGTANPDPVRIGRSDPVSTEQSMERLPAGIIHYVARTRESLVIADARQDQRFASNPYIVQQQLKSVLCVPLINQGQMAGIVYLENNLTTDAFTSIHLEVVQLLAAQAAIALDNARLYSELEQRVQQRTTELVAANHQLEREVLERQRSEQALRLIVEGTAAVTGKDFFYSLVRSLAKAIDVRYAFITECDSARPRHLRTIAFWQHDRFGDNVEYDVQGTPCAYVIEGERVQCYPQQLQSLFPTDQALVQMEAQSYAGVPLRNAAGQLLGHLAVLNDHPIENIPRSTAILEIFAGRAAAEMERQQAEEATRISQAKFSKAFRSSPSGITITTIKEGRFVEANDSFLRMVGYSHDEIIGQSSLELDMWVKTTDRDRITHLLQAQGTVSNVEVELRRKSGETFPGLVSAEIINLENEPCLLGITTDITVLKQASKAMERLAEIGELASVIVHEVRNPLTTVLMGLNAFKRLELPERFQEYLSLALDEGDRLQRLLNQILLYAKPQMLHLVELELNSLIVETLHTLQEMPVASAQHLQFTSTPETISLSADRDKLKQVLINLVTNACEAANDGDTITVSLHQDRANRVQMQIHNPGEPIATEILLQLTKPFFTTKTNGNGLGLAIVKRIVEAHGGDLTIDSSAEIGTIVTVELPLKL